MSQETDTGRLWGITSYFNPMGWKSRELNYHQFRKNLGMRLITVELSFDDTFTLREDDADILIQVSDGDPMWQKERLLNIALEALPGECDFVAWLDCDIVSATPKWPERICNALAKHPLIQAFSSARQMERSQSDQSRRIRNDGEGVNSLARCLDLKTVPDTLFSMSGGHAVYGYWAGYAWASRREVIEATGFYDALVMGAGDKAIYSAAYGKISEFVSALHFSSGQADHYRAWAERFHPLVDGNVGYADAEIFHLWHGDLEKRTYASRYDEFSRFEFDPGDDLRLGDAGAWRWGSRKPQMHEFVGQYLESRQEDG